MSAPAFATELNEFLAHLAEQDLVLDINHHHVKSVGGGKSSIRWVARDDVPAPDRTSEVDLLEYLRVLEFRDYSLLMLDGAYVQIEATFEGQEQIENRFCYVPCPLHLQEDDYELGGGERYPLFDLVKDFPDDEVRGRIRLRPTFRFELDPNNKKPGHPESHAHVGAARCRVPVVSGLHVGNFFRFIFKHYYPENIEHVVNKFGHPAPTNKRTLTAEDHEEVHFSFPHAP